MTPEKMLFLVNRKVKEAINSYVGAPMTKDAIRSLKAAFDNTINDLKKQGVIFKHAYLDGPDINHAFHGNILIDDTNSSCNIPTATPNTKTKGNEETMNLYEERCKKIDPGYGWKFVKVGDFTKPGDECWATGIGPWYKMSWDQEVRPHLVPIRHRIDVGVGYRLVEEDETILQGDQYFDVTGGWSNCRTTVGNTPKGNNSFPLAKKLTFRRKLVAKPHSNDGYDILDKNTVILSTDEQYLKREKMWVDVYPHNVGAATPGKGCFRRKSVASVIVEKNEYPNKCYENGKLRNPGEGYRWLKKGETLLKTDEWVYPDGHPSACVFPGTEVGKCPNENTYRRRKEGLGVDGGTNSEYPPSKKNDLNYTIPQPTQVLEAKIKNLEARVKELEEAAKRKPKAAIANAIKHPTDFFVNVSKPQDLHSGEGWNNGPKVKEYPDSSYLVNGNLVDPGKGYRLVKVGEMVIVGDEYTYNDGVSWNIRTFKNPGPLFKEGCTFRRKLPNPEFPKYPKYRWLKNEEIIKEGDSFKAAGCNIKYVMAVGSPNDFDRVSFRPITLEKNLNISGKTFRRLESHEIICEGDWYCSTKHSFPFSCKDSIGTPVSDRPSNVYILREVLPNVEIAD
jgi:Ni/Co efflux regulator RcnB